MLFNTFHVVAVQLQIAVWETVEHPERTRVGALITTFILLSIIVSITSFVLSGTPGIVKRPSTEEEWEVAMQAIEYATVTVFTLELLVRVWAR